MLKRHTFLGVPLFALLISAGGGLMSASMSVFGDEEWRDLHQEVRAGNLLSLAEIMDWLEARYRGQILEVELEQDDGRIEYEIEMIGPQGQVVEFEFDAASGELLSIEGANVEAMEKTRSD